MQVLLKPWSYSQGIRFSKEFLSMAGFTPDAALAAQVADGQIILGRARRHKRLKERASEQDGQLNLSGERTWYEPSGVEAWQ